ncbi:MAG: NADH:ubiquinone oxidoreductase subunit NDUFA12 [Alphaproteobacteria bacterium]
MASLLRSIFTWWNGATFGTLLNSWMNGRYVGDDAFGNRYYEQKKLQKGRKTLRRWVIYKDYAEASAVPPEWNAWLHHTVDEPPTVAPPKRHVWEKDHQPNLTGTPQAYRPKGTVAGSGDRQPATGDYEPWRPGDTKPGKPPRDGGSGNSAGGA